MTEAPMHMKTAKRPTRAQVNAAKALVEQAARGYGTVDRAVIELSRAKPRD